MSKRQQMDKETLVSIIRAHRTDSLGVEDSELSNERAQALNHYHGRPYGNEVDGRSQVVSRDLAEAVDWVMPGLMKVFTQSGRLAEFDPLGPEDEQLAQQESDYTNQVLMKDNNGFMVLHDAIKDTLLLKNGYVKHWWEVETKTEDESYSGLPMDAVVMLMTQLEQDGAEVEVVGQESKLSGPMPEIDQMSGQPMGPMPVELFDLNLKVTRKCGKVVWVAVPSEEVRVSKKCRGSLQDSPFTEHVTRKTRSSLIEMGMPRDFVDSLAAYGQSDNGRTGSQSLARDSTDDESDSVEQSIADRSMDEIEYCEAYLKVDYDGDGVAELRKVVTVADQIPPGDDWNEAIPAVPMTGFVAKRVPHRHVGESLDDEIADLQEIMTTLKRQLLDNIYRVNNTQKVVNENANLRDFMTDTPGGVKRTKGTDPVGNAFASIVTPSIISDILPVIGFFEDSKETRTGISKATTGLDPDVLQDTTKGAFMENLNRASQKMEMIARMLAESGIKESVQQVHGILIRHQDQSRTVQLRGKWVPVNPREWKNRTDLSVRVGLGTGSEEEKRSKLMLLSGMQDKLAQQFGLVGPMQGYALFEDIANTLGIDAPEKYVVAPYSPQHKQLQQEQAQAAQQAGQVNQLAEAEQVKAKAAMDVANLKDQFEREKAMLKAMHETQDREAQRRQDLIVERMRLASHEAVETMKAEMGAWIKGLQFDLGRPGISAGVQGAPGVGGPMDGGMGEMHQMPDGSTMAGPPMNEGPTA